MFADSERMKFLFIFLSFFALLVESLIWMRLIAAIHDGHCGSQTHSETKKELLN